MPKHSAFLSALVERGMLTPALLGASRTVLLPLHRLVQPQPIFFVICKCDANQ